MDIHIFETLASAGLIRRAQKALDKSSPQINDGSALTFSFEGHQGALDLHNPNNSQCDCAASGICKHIIAASIFAWQHATAVTTKAQTNVPQVDIDTLLVSAGKVKIRQLYRQVQCRWQAKITQHAAQVCVTINDHTLHFTKVAHINDIICDKDSQKYALLAIYLWLEQQGKTLPWPQWLQQEHHHQQTQLKQTQTQLNQDCYRELMMLAKVPLSQLRSESLLTIELLLIPMEKAGFNIAPLKRLCGTLARYLSGEHLRDTRTILLELARVLVMLERHEQPHINDDATAVAPITQLVCLGGYPWQASSGAHGLTLVFQDEYGRFVTLAESRTKSQQTLSYEQIWQAHSLLEGAPSGSRWFGQTQTISNAQLNGWQRLRQLKNTYVEPSDQSLTPHAIRDITQIDWQSDYLCFAPSVIHQHTFDEATQCMWLSYQDEQQNTIFFSLPYTKLTHHAINNMMRLKNHPPTLIMARIERDSTQWHLRPIAVKLERWINLYFDDLTDKKTTNIFSNWLAKQSPQPQLSSPRQDKVQQFLLKVLDELAQSPIMPQQALSEMALKLGLPTLSHFLAATGVKPRLQATYCAEQLLQLSCIKPILLAE